MQSDVANSGLGDSHPNGHARAGSNTGDGNHDIFAVLRSGKTPAAVINEKLKRCREFKEGSEEPVSIA